MIFVDSNVPMYLIGAPHPNRDRLERFLRGNPAERYISSAEVYQEVVHRYVAIDRRAAIADAFDFLDALLSDAVSVTVDDVRRAHEIAQLQPRFSGRDCLHLAVMERAGVRRILTLDGGFDAWPGIERLP